MDKQILAWHYCSTETFSKIVEYEKLHMGNVSFMNDSKEVEWFLDFAKDEAKKVDASATTRHYDNTVVNEDGTVSGSSSASTDTHIARFATACLDWLSRHPLDHVYISCFSKNGDDLSQWRGYADDGRGVAFQVDLAEVQEANEASVATDEFRQLSLQEVVYDVEEQIAHAESIIEEHLKMSQSYEPSGDEGDDDTPELFGLTCYNEIVANSPRFKNPAFVAESEVRLIARDLRTSMVGFNSEPDKLLSGVKMKVRNGKLVPYLELSLPSVAIKQVMTGPRFGSENDRAALEFFMRKQGISFPPVVSTASYIG